MLESHELDLLVRVLSRAYAIYAFGRLDAAPGLLDKGDE